MDGSKFQDGDLARVFNAALANAAAGKPSVALDLAAYLHLLEEVDGSDAEKVELLKIVESVMSAWVDMGFGIHSLQQGCGQVPDRESEPAKADSNVVESIHTERIEP